MNMDVVLLILAILALLIGIIGCVVPVLPGVPVAWLGLLVASFSSYSRISVALLIVTGFAALAVTVFDTVAPGVLTKRVGGTKAGGIGALVGSIVGMFLGPPGIILGSFAGACIGELVENHEDYRKAFRSAISTLWGFLLGTGLKLMVASAFIIIFILALLH